MSFFAFLQRRRAKPKREAKTRFGRWLGRHRRIRKTLVGLSVFLSVLLVGGGTFHALCHGPSSDVPATFGRAISASGSGGTSPGGSPASVDEDSDPASLVRAQHVFAEQPQVDAFRATQLDYNRTPESTYLTIPEWYEVFSYQEYADAINPDNGSRPSQFQYAHSIGQLWSLYCMAYHHTDGTYPFNGGNHLMIGVIGTSFSVEYGVKGAYEDTIGWLTEWDSTTTPEDHYAHAVAADYGTFVETEPWYRYPFGSKAIGIWKDTPLCGDHMHRKVERKMFLTTEYGVKWAYAGLIRAATGAIYGAPPENDYVWALDVHGDPTSVAGVRVAQTLRAPTDAQPQGSGDPGAPPGNTDSTDASTGDYILILPHYQGFTDGIPQLAARGAHFEQLSGNDRIIATLQAPTGWTPPDATATVLLQRQDVVTKPGIDRVVLLVPTRTLSDLLNALPAQHVAVEHLFDY